MTDVWNINVTFWLDVLSQVDLVCHGKTEVFPDKDGSDPYAVSAYELFNTYKI